MESYCSPSGRGSPSPSGTNRMFDSAFISPLQGRERTDLRFIYGHATWVQSAVQQALFSLFLSVNSLLFCFLTFLTAHLCSHSPGSLHANVFKGTLTLTTKDNPESEEARTHTPHIYRESFTCCSHETASKRQRKILKLLEKLVQFSHFIAHW